MTVVCVPLRNRGKRNKKKKRRNSEIILIIMQKRYDPNPNTPTQNVSAYVSLTSFYISFFCKPTRCKVKLEMTLTL